MTRAIRRATERGSATLLGVQLLALLTVVALVCAAAAAVVAAHRRAQAAADLGALSGAGALQHGAPACSAAEEVVRRNGARMRSCALESDVVMIRVEVQTLPLLGQVRRLEASARAGPVTSSVGPEQ